MANHLMRGEVWAVTHHFWLFAGHRRDDETIADPGGFSDFIAAFKTAEDAVSWFNEERQPGGRFQKDSDWAHVVRVRPGARLTKVAWMNALSGAWELEAC